MMMNEQPARLGPIYLAPGVTRKHVLCFLFASFVTIGLFTYLTLLTPYVLNVNLGLAKDQQGQVSGLLQFSQEIIILLCIGWWGAMSDRVGRRTVFIAGFAILSLAFALYSFATSVTELVGYRLIYGIGLAAASTMLATVLADYPAERSRGTLIGFSFLLNGLGSVFFFVVLSRLPTLYADQGADELWSGRLAYLTVAGIALFAAFMMLGLKPGITGKATAKNTDPAPAGGRSAGSPQPPHCPGIRQRLRRARRSRHGDAVPVAVGGAAGQCGWPDGGADGSGRRTGHRHIAGRCHTVCTGARHTQRQTEPGDRDDDRLRHRHCRLRLDRHNRQLSDSGLA